MPRKPYVPVTMPLPPVGSFSSAVPVANVDRVHRVILPLVRQVPATVVLREDAEAIYRDGKLRILWKGEKMLGAVPIRAHWELDPEEAQQQGLCSVEYGVGDLTGKLEAMVQECDDMMVVAGDDAVAKRIAERMRRMVVEALGMNP